MSFPELFELLKEAGLPGLVIGLAVLLLVYVLAFTDLLKVGWMKRAAAVIASYLFAGVDDVESAFTGAIALVFSTFAAWLIEAIKAQAAKPKA